ncbi:WD repeat-containing protein 60 isoform X2 [Orussus abietinus]|uniref:WD repeat-containing protein 60 isoform X2 n=1 Tax=Orussus abietinus TaxID=222816 RepID=UPI000625F752|nr:WD repeat-containing protein 60 isoform X2 [Orussus abietinus]
MSKKQGAIKKSLETNSESRTQIKTRTRSITDASSEQQGKAELRERKVVLDRRGAGDRPSKVSQNASSRVLPSKVIIGDATARSKTVHRNSTSSTARSTHEGSPRVTNHVTNKSTTSRTHSESIRKVTSSKEVDRSKAREKNRTGYTEKRGTSDIYIPKAQTSKYGSKSTDETRVKNTESSQVKDRGRRSEPKKTETGKESRHRLPSQERRKSRTLSPSEVKVLHSNANKSNVVRKTTSTTLPVKNNPKIDNASNNADSEYEYEDDFEDYESDFQECTDSEASEVSEASDNSRITPMLDPIELRTEQQKKVVSSGESRKTEEEHMLDSGHYELAEARKRAARVESMTANQSKTPSPPELRQPVNKAYREETTTETKSLPLSTDEGFEEDRSGDFAKSPPLSQVVFIDFQKAKKESPIKKSQVTLSRGKELLQMIKLDTVNWSLLECSPISYGEFIRIYGKLNTQQMSTQTKEDNLDIEIQTDEINCSNKWTQFPVKCRNRLKNNEDVKRFKMEQIGVGDDRDEESNLHSTKPSFDIIRLNEFMERAGKVMLAILEETRLGGNVLQSDVHELPFSEGVVNLSVNSVTFLTGRPVTIIHYSEVLNKVLLSIHSTTDEEVETSNKQDYLTDCCIGCLWNMSEPSKPTKLFYSPCPVTACCFHPTNYNLIFAGLQDGSMSLWDLKEDEMWHRKVTDKANESDWIIRSPTYVTAGNPEIDGHKSEIVAIHVLSKIEEEPIEASYNKFVPIQICSLDSDGYLIIWSTFRNIGSATNDLGLSYWGNVKLTKSQEISLGSRKTKIPVWWSDVH